MQVAGIIAEYNPFHAGHCHHIAETKARLAGAPVVCFMSGNFVQRGEPAILHKTARAKAAVQSGADLVFELPVAAVLSPAEGFAQAGVFLAAATGIVSHLSFGCECGELALLQQAASAIYADEAKAARAALLRQGVSYPQAQSAALPPPLRAIAQSPNNLLAMEYLRAIDRLGAALSPLAILRKGSGHDAPAEDGIFPSASAIRKIYTEGRTPAKDALPEASLGVIAAEKAAGRFPANKNALDAAVVSALRKAPNSRLSALPEVTEGLDNRFFAAARSHYTTVEILAAVKTKRYAMARLRRCLYACLLGLTKENQRENPAYLRLLAASETGRGLLAQMRKTSALPVITKPAALLKHGKSAKRQAELEALADDLFALTFPNPAAGAAVSFFKTTPYMDFFHP